MLEVSLIAKTVLKHGSPRFVYPVRQRDLFLLHRHHDVLHGSVGQGRVREVHVDRVEAQRVRGFGAAENFVMGTFSLLFFQKRPIPVDQFLGELFNTKKLKFNQTVTGARTQTHELQSPLIPNHLT